MEYLNDGRILLDALYSRISEKNNEKKPEKRKIFQENINVWYFTILSWLYILFCWLYYFIRRSKTYINIIPVYTVALFCLKTLHDMKNWKYIWNHHHLNKISVEKYISKLIKYTKTGLCYPLNYICGGEIEFSQI